MGCPFFPRKIKKRCLLKKKYQKKVFFFLGWLSVQFNRCNFVLIILIASFWAVAKRQIG